ncbi:MAG: flagellar type III secretion system pore protein FliP, partial [Gemmatimonadales bacterium]|nr:flagellar type III secretion system pore protein FliP [Gemmatimonadales bacterium]
RAPAPPAGAAAAPAAKPGLPAPVLKAKGAKPVITASPRPTPPPRVTAPGAALVPTPRVAPVPEVQLSVGNGDGAFKLTGTVGLVVFLGAMTLLPALFLLMTSFTRIVIVLSFLRTALGTQSAPPTQLLVAISILLTGMVMHPVLDQANRTALTPFLEGRMPQVEAYQAALVPFRAFMLNNTRDQDLAAFAEMSGRDDVAKVEDLPTVTVMSAFITGELRTAFQMGFVVFLPFLVVDLVVASVLTSMGMMMLPPALVSLPFKLLLFVLADGWTLVIRNLVASFRV